MTAIYVVIAEARGSAPRDAGTAMKVTGTHTQGTIGGGALEHMATARARQLLAAGREAEERVPLGPRLGQCCGGAVTLSYTFEPHQTDTDEARSAFDAPRRPVPLWLWGAGHVGRAIVRQASPALCQITWVDEAKARFPDPCPDWTEIVPAADMPRLARRGARGATHLIFTYSHEIDLALCDALLTRGVKGIGLIGSETKWARFRSRLCALGHNDAQIGRITCPIGDKSLGKHPDAIARGVLSGLIS